MTSARSTPAGAAAADGGGEGASAAPAARRSALAGLRVLDLSSRHSHYCGKLFADMGADVILVEPPGQASGLRATPPYIGDRCDPEYGIAHVYYNTSKRGVTLDLAAARGQELLRRLAVSADLLIEDRAPGELAGWGLDYPALAAVAPRLVVCSITPFGQTGPHAGYAADDLTLLAMGGFLNMTGYPDIAPTQPAGNQAHAMGNMFGAVGAMMAVLEAGTSGRGQHVDVSIQECVTMALENAAQFFELEKRVRTRFAGSQRQAGTGIFECADGYVYVFAGGMAAIRFWPNLVRWMNDENVPGAHVLDSPQWADMDYLNSDAAKDTFAEMFAGFTRERTKEDLYRTAQARRVPLCPVSSPADVAASPQLAARGYFAGVAHAPSGRTLKMPGAPYVLSATPWRIARPAPRLGEHNAEVYGAIGVTPAEQAELSAAGVI